ncbi:hypothetical protein ACFWIO_18300 [Streptomyces diastatochromogenes]|uniref:hypothetical protein n=1 Tax=Streptomyces diastatochromogenes TaxID=42236 RepID=UPI0036672EB5
MTASCSASNSPYFAPHGLSRAERRLFTDADVEAAIEEAETGGLVSLLAEFVHLPRGRAAPCTSEASCPASTCAPSTPASANTKTANFGYDAHLIVTRDAEHNAVLLPHQACAKHLAPTAAQPGKPPGNRTTSLVEKP